jgi:hypothetical protein
VAVVRPGDLCSMSQRGEEKSRRKNLSIGLKQHGPRGPDAKKETFRCKYHVKA